MQIQCCYRADAALTTPARRLVAEQVIASSGQAGKIATQAKVRTLVLTHFDAMEPRMRAALEADVRRDFAGPLYLAEDLLSLAVVPKRHRK
jgi:ribonuclease Z